jgi:hypothetical protein
LADLKDVKAVLVLHVQLGQSATQPAFGQTFCWNPRKAKREKKRKEQRERDIDVSWPSHAKMRRSFLALCTASVLLLLTAFGTSVALGESCNRAGSARVVEVRNKAISISAPFCDRMAS